MIVVGVDGALVTASRLDAAKLELGVPTSSDLLTVPDVLADPDVLPTSDELTTPDMLGERVVDEAAADSDVTSERIEVEHGTVVLYVVVMVVVES